VGFKKTNFKEPYENDQTFRFSEFLARIIFEDFEKKKQPSTFTGDRYQ
jgi:hypothetical protein